MLVIAHRTWASGLWEVPVGVGLARLPLTLDFEFSALLETSRSLQSIALEEGCE